MRNFAFVVGAALVLAGCSSVPTQPVPQAFGAKLLNLASIADQISNMTNIGINTEVNTPVIVAPVTQVNALGNGNQSASPNLALPIYQGMDINVSQLMHQMGSTM